MIIINEKLPKKEIVHQLLECAYVARREGIPHTLSNKFEYKFDFIKELLSTAYNNDQHDLKNRLLELGILQNNDEELLETISIGIGDIIAGQNPFVTEQLFASYFMGERYEVFNGSSRAEKNQQVIDSFCDNEEKIQPMQLEQNFIGQKVIEVVYSYKSLKRNRAPWSQHETLFEEVASQANNPVIKILCSLFKNGASIELQVLPIFEASYNNSIRYFKKSESNVNIEMYKKQSDNLLQSMRIVRKIDKKFKYRRTLNG